MSKTLERGFYRSISLIFISLLTLCGAEGLKAADKYDADGYPEIYLRGTFDNSNWGVAPENKFERNGENYSITLEGLTGEFKIAGTDWKFNLGAPDESRQVVVGASEVQGVQNGLNYHGNFETGVKISFTLSIDNEKALPTIIRFEAVTSPTAVISGTLPVMYIEVRDANGGFNNEVISKDLLHKNNFEGVYWIEIPENASGEFESVGSAEEPLPLLIKGRGNYTFRAFAKKPYKIKLDKKQNLLGLTPDKSKHYALLAHADDNLGFLRNFTGFALGKLIGLPWTPSQHPVELVINGDYRGLYFLTESIRAEKGRVDIEELNDLEETPELVTGGYIVELDNYEEENQIRMDEKGVVEGHKDKLRVTFNTPELYSAIQRRFVEQQFSKINDLVGLNSDELWAYLDLDDAVRYYLVEEIISHTEAYHGSTYLFRERGAGEKWQFSPLWDCGNAFNGSTSNHFFVHSPFGNTWIPSFLQNKKFKQRVCDTWLWFMSTAYPELKGMMDDYVSAIEQAAVCDAKRWKNKPLPTDNGAKEVANNSDMKSRHKKVSAHLSDKIKWLKTIYGDFTAKEFDEPQRDATPAAALPDFVTDSSGILLIPSDVCDSNAVYYNMQGLRVNNPKPGQILIRVCGADARKVMITPRD